MTRPGQTTTVWALAALGLTVLTSTATAQYRAPVPPPVEAVPVPPSEPAPADDTKPPREVRASGGSAAEKGWEKEFVLDGFWEQNVGFVAPPGPNDAAGSLRATLVRWRRSARTNLRLTFEGAGYAYAQLSEFDRLDYAASLQLDSRLSTRTTSSLTARFADGHSDTESILIEQGVILPPVPTKTGEVGFGFGYRLGQRTSASLDGLWQQVQFDSDILLDTTLWTGGLSVRRTLSARDSLAALARVERSDDGVTIRQIPRLTLDLSHRFNAGLTLSLGAGVDKEGVTSAASGAALPSYWGFTGSAGLSGRIRRATIVAHYEHALRPPIGLGVTELVDLFSLNTNVPIGRSFALLASGTTGWTRQPKATTSTGYHNTDMYLGGSWSVARNTQLVLGYKLRTRGVISPHTDVRNDRASLTVVWTPGRASTPTVVPRGLAR